MKAKKKSLDGFVTLVNEDEWKSWEEVPSWSAPRGLIAAKKLSGKKPTVFSRWFRDGPDMEHFFFVRVAYEGKPVAGQLIPFYQTRQLLVASERLKALLTERYAGRFGMAVDTLPEPVVSVWEDTLNAIADREKLAREEVGLKNVLDGGTYLLKLLNLKAIDNPPVPLRVILSAQEAGTSADFKDEQTLLRYSRAKPFSDGVFGALCDLGSILRNCDVGKEVVDAYAKELTTKQEALKQPRHGILKEILQKYEVYHRFFQSNFVYFLKWKYDAEEHDGEINIGQICEDIKTLSQDGATEEEYSLAVWLLGARAGFRSYSSSFHFLMRKRGLAEDEKRWW